MNRRGQALVEYVLIIALISVITISIVSYFGGYLKDAITKSSCGIADKVYVEGEKPGEAKCVSESELEEMQKEWWNMKKKRGQALVEFVIILPIFVFMVLAIIDIGKILFMRNELENELSDVIDLYRNQKTYDEITNELKKQDEDILLEVKNNDNETVTFYLTW